jgi:catechol 2,3-dioxygenase-like lactoylglutathione lyase family enzyme
VRLDHVHVGCRDRAAIADWFGRVLGLAPAPAFAAWAQGGPLLLAGPDGGNALALFEVGEGPPQDDRDHTIAFVTDAQGFLDLWRRADELRLEHRSGRPLSDMGPVDHDGLAWSLYPVSPEGHRFEVTCHDVEAVAQGLRP